MCSCALSPERAPVSKVLLHLIRVAAARLVSNIILRRDADLLAEGPHTENQQALGQQPSYSSRVSPAARPNHNEKTSSSSSFSFFFFFPNEMAAELLFCGCTVVTRDALSGPHWSRLHFITFGHQSRLVDFIPGLVAFSAPLPVELPGGKQTPCVPSEVCEKIVSPNSLSKK